MSQMIEVKTAELEGAALDWAVAKATDASQVKVVEWGDGNTVSCVYQLADGGCWANHYSPSTEWDQGGVLIEQHRISTEAPGVSSGFWTASMPGSALMEICQGPTPLVAGCRRLVREHLGDTVQVPAELVTP